MSFQTALGNFLGGQHEALQHREEAQDRRAYQQQQLELEKQRMADERAYREQQGKRQTLIDAANAQTAGLDPATMQPLEPLPIPKELSRYTPDPSSENRRYLQLAAYYAGQGRPVEAERYQKIAGSYALGAQQFGAAALSGSRQELVAAQATEATARAGYYSQRLGVDLQKANVMLQAAQGHDRARADAAQKQYDATVTRAGISAHASVEGRVLAGYYALQGREVGAAASMAIAGARDAQAASKQAALGLGAGVAPVTPQSLYQPPAQADPANLLNAVDKILGRFPQGQPVGTEPPGGNNYAPPPGKDVVATYANMAKHALAQKTTPHFVRAKLKDLVEQKALTAEQAQQIEAQLGIRTEPLAPLPVGTGHVPQASFIPPLWRGGSQAGVPFR